VIRQSTIRVVTIVVPKKLMLVPVTTRFPRPSTTTELLRSPLSPPAASWSVKTPGIAPVGLKVESREPC